MGYFPQKIGITWPLVELLVASIQPHKGTFILSKASRTTPFDSASPQRTSRKNLVHGTQPHKGPQERPLLLSSRHEGPQEAPFLLYCPRKGPQEETFPSSTTSTKCGRSTGMSETANAKLHSWLLMPWQTSCWCLLPLALCCVGSSSVEEDPLFLWGERIHPSRSPRACIHFGRGCHTLLSKVSKVWKKHHNVRRSLQEMGFFSKL